MLSGVAVLPAALASGALLGVGAGAIGASGFNLATMLAAPDRQATVAGVVSLALALGSVVVTIAGAEILATTQIPGVSAAGAPASTAAGIDLYVALAGLLFLLATVPALAVLRSRPGAESPW